MFYYTPKGAFIKGLNRKAAEVITLFFVLFFPRGAPDFFSLETVSQSLFYRIPALILILILADKAVTFRLKRDCAVFVLTLPALFALGFLVSLTAELSGIVPPQPVPAPHSLSDWTSAVLFSLSVGFLEEAFFRLYLPGRILLFKMGRSLRSVIIAYAASALLFALCHTWEGPWGIVNALIAAALLSAAYIKSGSFIGIALVHGMYNVLAFALAAFAK